MTHLEEEFEEVAETMVSAYRVLRRLAGTAIVERDDLKKRVAAAIELLVDIEVSDDIDHVHTIARQIRRSFDNM